MTFGFRSRSPRVTRRHVLVLALAFARALLELRSLRHSLSHALTLVLALAFARALLELRSLRHSLSHALPFWYSLWLSLALS